MASRRFKQRWTALLGGLGWAERLIYNGVSAIAIAGVLAYGHWALGSPRLFDPQGAARWLMWSVSGAGFVLMLLALRSYDLPLFAGLKQWRLHRTGEPIRIEPLHLGGLHRYVRHPIYTAGLMILWARPMDAATLWTNLFATAYLLAGSRFEERRLIDLYGAAYAEYRRHAPGLIPWRGRALNDADAERLQTTCDR
ncbi:putative S-isoprenylcysteine methyltransferase-like protein [Magnetofaba australis IT-1]|uniref:Putative S-isoprenylcysteine methyltransferase-like protein n=2 Tax=Magnetofaba TaxID=1472292 RepID=A0A1Y2K867_9PROT|nr:putative S-isoprenylcysteine methyltransferase-like protein [Magnetofaba australis IT-1]